MRVMAIIRATEDRPPGDEPELTFLTEMGPFNEALARAGVLLDGEGLQASGRGARIRLSGTTRTVIDGPSSETTGPITAYWLWQVRSLDEAIEWAKRCPNPTGVDAEIELRPVVESDVPANYQTTT
jgi:hypothetical protein